MMLKIALRNLSAHKGRFALTTFGVVLAVSFVVSAFVLGDGLRGSFDELGAEIAEKTDIEVRPIDEFGNPTVLTQTDLDVVLATPGVGEAFGSIEAPENSVRPILANGDEISTQGPPQLAFNWAGGLSPLVMVEGDTPEVGQFVVDLGSADRHNFEMGETYTFVTTTGRHELELSGITRFGSDNSTLGATLMNMNTEQAPSLFGTTGFESIGIALADDADEATVMGSLTAAFPAHEVVDQQTILEESSDEFGGQIELVRNILLGFAGVSLLVSVFIIYNTFAIVLSQRTREIGLLRLVGADASQVQRSSIGEAAFVGVISSMLGIPGGVAVAAGITALMGLIGAELPDYAIIIAPRTLIASALVGIGATVVAAWAPARKAARIPAMAALREGVVSDAEGRRRRTTIGFALAGVGLAAGALGVAGIGGTASTLTLMVVGGVALVVGVTLFSPLLVDPVVRVMGIGLRRTGIPGRLAIDNASRNSSRTATTAAALMIGLAVVGMALVVGESIKAQLGETLDSAVKADYLLTDQASLAGFPNQIVEEIEQAPEFGAVTGFRYSEIRIDGGTAEDVSADPLSIVAADLVDVPELIDLDVSSGGYDTRSEAVLVAEKKADELGVGVGDVLDVTFASGDAGQLDVVGIFDDVSVLEVDFLVDTSSFSAAGVDESDLWIAFSPATGTSPDAVVAAIAAIETTYPQGELETAAEFRERLEGLVDQVLSVLNALVVLAVVIALIGIANTLALSVHERTREIGLARAVGMSRRQTRRMIRYESAIISTFGALLGVVVGIVFGWAIVVALPESYTNILAIPFGQIAVLVVVAALAGLAAAVLPARRAGRMNVLDAIAQE